MPASPAKVSGERAQRHAEPRHLGEPARDQRGPRVEAQAQPVRDSRGHRHHVLERAAELDPDDVVVGVDAELVRR